MFFVRLIRFVLRLLWWPQLGAPALLGWPREQAPHIYSQAVIGKVEPRSDGLRMDGHEAHNGGRVRSVSFA